MNKFKSLIRGGMNINALSVISLLSFVVSCTLFSFSAQKLYGLKSEKRKILEQTQYFSERIPLAKDEIEAIKERLALKEQEAQKVQLAAQKEQDRKEKLAATLNEGKMSARRKYFLEHGMTPEQAQQLKASRRKKNPQQQLTGEGLPVTAYSRRISIRANSYRKFGLKNADLYIHRAAEADRKLKSATAAYNRGIGSFEDAAKAELELQAIMKQNHDEADDEMRLRAAEKNAEAIKRRVRSGR